MGYGKRETGEVTGVEGGTEKGGKGGYGDGRYGNRRGCGNE
jgi:hypothetical protein